MSKQTDRQKMEHYRQKVAKEYKGTIEELRRDNNYLRNRVVNLEKENDRLRAEFRCSQEKLEKLKEYNNISEEDIRKLLDRADADMKFSEILSILCGASKGVWG